MKQSKKPMNVYLQANIINKLLGDSYLEELISAEDLDPRLYLDENIEMLKNRVKEKIRGILV